MGILDVKGLNVYYGDLHILWDLNFSVERKELVSIIGANGAGKTTLLKSITGLVKPSKGEIIFNNKRIDVIEPYKIAEEGITYIPEGRHIFPYLTVQENLELGAFNKRAREKIRGNLERTYTLFPVLKERKKQLAGTLSGGEQQMLAIGRGLMADPSFIMFDEPSVGLAPVLVSEVFKIIKKIHQENITVLLVEQNAYKALSLADRAYILENGRITLEGTGKNLVKNEYVKKAYLGI